MRFDRPVRYDHGGVSAVRRYGDALGKVVVKLGISILDALPFFRELSVQGMVRAVLVLLKDSVSRILVSSSLFPYRGRDGTYGLSDVQESFREFRRPFRVSSPVFVFVYGFPRDIVINDGGVRRRRIRNRGGILSRAFYQFSESIP